MDQDIRLYGPDGQPIKTASLTDLRRPGSLDENQVRLQLRQVIEQVVDEVPASKLNSPGEVRDALLKALKKSDPKVKYEFDVGSGKLKLSYSTRRGPIYGEINAYSVAKKAGAYSGVGWGALYWASLGKPAPQPAAKAPNQPKAYVIAPPMPGLEKLLRDHPDLSANPAPNPPVAVKSSADSPGTQDHQ